MSNNPKGTEGNEIGKQKLVAGLRGIYHNAAKDGSKPV